MKKLCVIFLTHLSLNAFAVVNGNEAVPHSKPYQVAVTIDGSAFCGGVLISPNWVLTAGDCISGASSWVVTLGGHNRITNEPEQINISTRDVILHEKYNPTAKANNIAIIRLPGVGVQLNKNISTIPLADSAGDPTTPSAVQISVWGRSADAIASISPVLREGNMTAISNAECKTAYGVVTDQNFCTKAAPANTCNGDIGGPVVYNGKLFGIMSFGAAAGCEAGFPSVHIDVRYFREWIRGNSGI